MKRIHILKKIHLLLPLLALSMAAGCRQEFVEQDYTVPEIMNLSCSAGSEVEAASDISWSADIHDDAVSIIRMNVQLICNDEIISSDSRQLQGKDYSFTDERFHVPFVSNFAEDSDAFLVFSVMNRTGQECRDTVEFTITRPEIPATLYLHYGDRTVEMTRSALNPYEYSTPDSQFPGNLTAWISTSESLAESRLVWGYSAVSGVAGVLENGQGNGFVLNFGNANVSNIYFNTLTFAVTSNILEGVYINGIKLDENASLDGAYASPVYFENGQKVTVNGIDNISQAYNRDFFSYDSSTGELTFLRETGSWDVIYSAKYNYIWVFRADDTAPDCIWLVGQGFTSASVWHDDYNSGGWGSDFLRTGYAVKVSDNVYQATVYINNTHEWAGEDIGFTSDRNGTPYAMVSNSSNITGDSDGFHISASNTRGICTYEYPNVDENGVPTSSSGGVRDSDFVPGYYRITIEISGGTAAAGVNLERL